MAKYLMKYKGTYRLKAAIDQSTNDYPRDDSGGIDSSFDDIYIKCYGGAQIYHYGFSTLVAYIPSIGRGHNILKAIANDIGLPEYETYEELYKALEDEGTVQSIMENDKEIEFKFHARKLEYIALFLKPAIAGADISPFSTKNLPKCDYPIPEEDLAEYNAILDSMDSKDYLLVSRVTDAFLTNKLQKSKQYRTIDLKKDMKKKCLKTKEYIHSLGEWNEYIEYLKKEICK